MSHLAKKKDTKGAKDGKSATLTKKDQKKSDTPSPRMSASAAATPPPERAINSPAAASPASPAASASASASASAAAAPAVAPSPSHPPGHGPTGLGPDPHSWANYHEAKVTRYDIALRTDFCRKILHGHVDVTALVETDGAQFLKLDAKDLAIEGVCVKQQSGDWESVDWVLPHHHHLAKELDCPIPADMRKAGTHVTFRIAYSTTKNSGGIQWLDASQTGTKKHPFLFTQCEAILARTLLPCQDTPAVKCPYSIRVTCPSPLVAVCSGLEVDPNEESEDNKDNKVAGGDKPLTPRYEEDGWLTWAYYQPLPIPAYLIAIAVGFLGRARVGPRSTVWAEKHLVKDSQSEFSEHTEAYIAAAEKVCGVSYDWGKYDMVVLPGSFPYGGMENPNLTFLSSSLLAGDRSLTNVVAHEITHSWAGNYVTNSNWSDFWLNEGFTVYIERLILCEIFGPKYRDFEILIGFKDLVKTVELLKDHPEWTKLRPNLVGVDPDDAFSKIPYEKGSLFLLYLEKSVGGPLAMRAWLKTYFTEFRGKSLDVMTMKAHFLNFFSTDPTHKVDPQVLKQLDWDTWLNEAGLPSYDPKKVVDCSMAEQCEALTKKWMADGGASANSQDMKGWLAKQVMFFLDDLMLAMQQENKGAVPTATLDKLDEVYGFSSSRNVEIAFRFFMLNLRNGHRRVLPLVSDFLSRHGRGLYVKPLYKALKDLDPVEAKQIYRKHKTFYHSVIRNYAEKSLQI